MHRFLLALIACALCPVTTALADDAESIRKLIADLGLREAPAPVRERPDWRPPKKIVVLGAAGPPGGDPEKSLAAAAPGVKLVIVSNVREAAAEAVDADIVVGITSYPGICEPEILNAARELRWILA